MAKQTRKLNVDPSTVPNLGSAQTEAGISQPGFSQPGLSSPGFSRPSYYSGINSGQGALPYSNYKTFNQDKDLGSYALESIAGITRIFGMAELVGKRINPGSTDGPLGSWDCKNCLAKKAGVETAEQVVARNIQDSAHDAGAIQNAIAAENQVPFAEVSEEDQALYTGSVIASLNKLGGLVLVNGDEFQSLCPNFPELGANQKKAAVVFIYSEVFKQTSNYNSNLSTPVRVRGRSSAKVGLCQIEYFETKAAVEEDERGTMSESESEFNSTYAKNPFENISICTSLLFLDALDNPGKEGAIERRFPNLDFKRIKQKMSELKMCQKSTPA